MDPTFNEHMRLQVNCLQILQNLTEDLLTTKCTHESSHERTVCWKSIIHTVVYPMAFVNTKQHTSCDDKHIINVFPYELKDKNNPCSCYPNPWIYKDVRRKEQWVYLTLLR